MKTMKRLLLVLAMVLMAAPANADEDMTCESDADCPDGYGCMMMSCACAPCPPDEECEPCDCPEDGEGWCEYIGDDDWDDYGFYGSECEENDDCPMGFVCETIMMPCAAPDCPPCTCAGCDPDDPDCDPEADCECPECPEWEPCDPEEIGMCMYDMVDCETDADCGEGFECLEVEECWGSGGGCLCDCACEACAEGEECPPCECPDCDCGDEEFEEGCEVVGSFCAPKEQACETDDDCLDGWECMFMATGGGGTNCACEACPDGEECPPCDCDDEPEEWVDEEGFCVPDGWSEIIEDSGMAGANYEEARDAMAGELWGEGEATGDDNDKTVQIATPEASPAGDNGATEDSSGTCSTSGRPAAAAPMMILFIALAAALLIPRRSRITSR